MMRLRCAGILLPYLWSELPLGTVCFRVFNPVSDCTTIGCRSFVFVSAAAEPFTEGWCGRVKGRYFPFTLLAGFSFSSARSSRAATKQITFFITSVAGSGGNSFYLCCHSLLGTKQHLSVWELSAFLNRDFLITGKICFSLCCTEKYVTSHEKPYY